MAEAFSDGEAGKLGDVCQLLDQELQQSDLLIASLRNSDFKTSRQREEQSRSLRQRLRLCESLAQALDGADVSDPSFGRAQSLLRRFIEDYVHPDERHTWSGYTVAHLRRSPPQMQLVELA